MSSTTQKAHEKINQQFQELSLIKESCILFLSRLINLNIAGISNLPNSYQKSPATINLQFRSFAVKANGGSDAKTFIKLLLKHTVLPCLYVYIYILKNIARERSKKKEMKKSMSNLGEKY